MATSKVSLKLLIDTKCNKVLFAEAGKDFVDFLFYLLALPLGTVIRLLTKSNMVGCLGNLYDSIETLSDTYMQTGNNKNSVLNPNVPSSLPIETPLLLTRNEAHSPDVGVGMFPCVSATETTQGFVKGVVTYMVMDNLEVTPMSTISSMTLLNTFKVQGVGALKELVVDLGMQEGLKLLEASLQSKTVLTSVFLEE